MSKFILKNMEEDGDSGWVTAGAVSDQRQRLMIHVDGDLDGATVTVNLRPVGSTRDGLTNDDLTFDAPDMLSFPIAAGMEIKATVTDAGSSTDIDVWIG